MLTSRRLFVTGLTSLVVASPAIVRASSLMDIKGYIMDPKVLAFQRTHLHGAPVKPSGFWTKSILPEYAKQERACSHELAFLIRLNDDKKYAYIRESEVIESQVYADHASHSYNPYGDSLFPFPPVKIKDAPPEAPKKHKSPWPETNYG